jgi:hypothetical protein
VCAVNSCSTCLHHSSHGYRPVLILERQEDHADPRDAKAVSQIISRMYRTVSYATIGFAGAESEIQ